MSVVLDELVKLLSLERIEDNRFRGQSQDLGWGTVFGGQVLGQALSAAAQTVPPERHVHSLHAYFLQPGDVSEAIVYDVDRIRDGSSLTTRRVVAIQTDRPIFNMSASFQTSEPGFEHHEPMPDVPAPETLETEQQLAAKAGWPPAWLERGTAERPFELRPVQVIDPLRPTPLPPRRMNWLRTVSALPDSPALHYSLLAYASDRDLLGTTLLPHGVSVLTPGMQIASLDHVIWFHQPLRVDDWLLHVMESPVARRARGLAHGRIYTRSGALVASTAQEGLIRRRAPPP